MKPTFGKPATSLTQRQFGRPQSWRPRRVRKTSAKNQFEIDCTACRAGSWLCLASVSKHKTPCRCRQGQIVFFKNLCRLLLKPCKKFDMRTMRTWSTGRRSRPHETKRRKTRTKRTGRKHGHVTVSLRSTAARDPTARGSEDRGRTDRQLRHVQEVRRKHAGMQARRPPGTAKQLAICDTQ